MPKREKRHRLRKKREQKTKETICNRYNLDRIINKIIILKIDSDKSKKELITGQLIKYRFYRCKCKYVSYELTLLVNGQEIHKYLITDDERLKISDRFDSMYNSYQLAKIKKILNRTEELIFKLENNV